MLQREQKHETENENGRRDGTGSWGSTPARTAAAGAPAEVAGGQLRSGVVTSHRVSPWFIIVHYGH